MDASEGERARDSKQRRPSANQEIDRPLERLIVSSGRRMDHAKCRRFRGGSCCGTTRLEINCLTNSSSWRRAIGSEQSWSWLGDMGDSIECLACGSLESKGCIAHRLATFFGLWGSLSGWRCLRAETSVSACPQSKGFAEWCSEYFHPFAIVRSTERVPQSVLASRT